MSCVSIKIDTSRVAIDHRLHLVTSHRFHLGSDPDRKLQESLTENSDRETSSEQWCEDPFVVSIDTVVGDHRIALTATGDAKKGPVGVC